MTVQWQNDAQVPATLGTTVGTGNTGTGTNFGGGANNALGSVSIGSANTFVEDAAHTPAGLSQVWKMTHGGTAQNNAFMSWATPQADLTYQGAFYYSGTPSGASWTFGRAFSDTGFVTNVFTLQVTTTNKAQVAEAGGGTASSTASLTPGTWYYFVFRYQQSGLTAVLNVYPFASGTTAATASLSSTGSYTLGSARFGISNSTAIGVAPVWWGLLQIGSGGVVARQDFGNTPPIADPGPDQTVEPWALVTLDATNSTAPSGTISTYGWTQTAGTSVTLSSTSAVQPTFTAPASISDQVLTFSLTVTDSNGSTSVAATVNVTVLAATEYYLDISGTWQPMQIMQL